jgi:hypothetical protein
MNILYICNIYFILYFCNIRFNRKLCQVSYKGFKDQQESTDEAESTRACGISLSNGSSVSRMDDRT